METGLLNFHDEEHFPVFSDENTDLVNENSIFNSFVEVFNDNIGSSPWILPEEEIELGLSSVVSSEPKEDFRKTFQDWQQHISNLQARDDDIKDALCDSLGDLGDIFNGEAKPRQKQVPEKEKVQSYKVAKRKGLVLKLTKKKADCDKSNLTKPKKVDQSFLTKNKKKEFSPPRVDNFDFANFNHDLVQNIKTEPFDDCDFVNNLDIVNIEMSSENKNNIDVADFIIPSIKLEPELPRSLPQIKQEPDFEIASPQIKPEPELPVSSPQLKLESDSTVSSNHMKLLPDSPVSSPQMKLEAELTISSPQIKLEPDLIEWHDFTVCTDIGEIVSETVINDDQYSIKTEQIDNIIEEEVNSRCFSLEEEGLCSEDDEEEKTADIKSELALIESDDSDSDDESGSTLVPVLETDVRTLLEQFEKPTCGKDSELTEGNVIKPLAIDVKPEVKVKEEPSVENGKLIPREVTVPIPSNKSIMDALPREVIEKIKESCIRKKKCVAVVEAERLPIRGNKHLKDAGASPIKAVRMMNKQRSYGESAKLLDHAYCSNEQQQHESAENRIKEENERGERDKKIKREEKHWDSKKDSGLESGDVSDSSESLKEKLSASSLQIKIEDGVDVKIEPGEIVEEPTKKKKLNLEEYRNRRKHIKPKSPIKSRTGGWNIPNPNPNTNETDGSKEMVNAEVQVELENTKSEQLKENNPSKRDVYKSERVSRRRRSSSSSSNNVSKSRYRRRGRSNRRRNNRSHWSCSRSRSRSRSQTPSRSRSRSRSSSFSDSSSSSRSRSRSRGSRRRKGSFRRRSGSSATHTFRHKGGKRFMRRTDDWSPVEKMQQVEERRVIYVGRLEEGTTKAELRERFASFGPIVDISLHFREKGDNYGFVTFAYKVDAYEAVEHGNDYPLVPKYDICFGGRRAFCKQRYSDLDSGSPQGYSPHQQNSRSSDSFDNLLREAQKKLKRSSHV